MTQRSRSSTTGYGSSIQGATEPVENCPTNEQATEQAWTIRRPPPPTCAARPSPPHNMRRARALHG